MASIAVMMRVVALFLVFFLQVATSAVLRRKQQIRQRREGETALICLILKVHVQTGTGDEDYLECDLISEDDGAMVHGLQIELPTQIVDDNYEALHKGEWYVQIYGGAQVVEEQIEGYGSLRTSITVPKSAEIVTLSPEEGDLYMQAVQGVRSGRYLIDSNATLDESRSLAAKQARLVMVVRVWLGNSQPTYSAAQLKEYYFDLNSYSVARQYALCSSGWLWFKGYNAANPVVNVYVPGQVGSFTKETLWKAALNQLQSQLHVSSITSITHHVAFILPAGVQGGNWFGAGTVGSYRSIFNNTYGGIPNTAMHELGHNLGMGHAGLGSDQYGDETDVMGYGAYKQFGPSKCFNGAHLWSLGWFTDRAAVINPFNHIKIQMASFADYAKTTAGHYVVVKVGDFYLAFNRASGVNAGTGAVPDHVTVSQMHAGEYSTRAGALTVNGGAFEVGNYGGSSANLIIKACSSFTWNTIEIVVVSIGVGNGNC